MNFHDTNIQVAIIGFSGVIIGVLLTFLGVIINNIAQRKREKDKFKQEVYLKEDEKRYKQNQDKINAIVEIVKLLNYFEDAISLTSSSIDTTKKASIIQNNENYKRDKKKLHRLDSLVCVYTPNFYDKVRIITRNHGTYRLAQSNLIANEANKELEDMVLNEVIQITQKCSENISELRYDLRDLCEKLLDFN